MTDPTTPMAADKMNVSAQPITASDSALADVPPIAQPNKRRKALLIASGAATAVLLIGVGIVTTLGGGESPDAPAQTKQTRLAAAREQCTASSFAELGDDDRTLTLHGDGKESSGLDYNVLECFWRALDIPDSVLAEIEATRALDGRQTGDWDGMHASWSYHPDSGLQMVITLTD